MCFGRSRWLNLSHRTGDEVCDFAATTNTTSTIGGIDDLVSDCILEANLLGELEAKREEEASKMLAEGEASALQERSKLLRELRKEITDEEYADATKNFNNPDISNPGKKRSALRWFLTIPGHIPKDKWIEWVTTRPTLIKDKGEPVYPEFSLAKGSHPRCYIAHEKADEKANYPHTHILMWFKKSIQVNVHHWCYKIDGEDYITKKGVRSKCGGAHPHIDNPKSNGDPAKQVKDNSWFFLCRYICKEDDDCANEIMEWEYDLETIERKTAEQEETVKSREKTIQDICNEALEKNLNEHDFMYNLPMKLACQAKTLTSMYKDLLDAKKEAERQEHEFPSKGPSVENMKLFPWQQDFMNRIWKNESCKIEDGLLGGRQIMWIFSKGYGCGKSALVSHLKYKGRKPGCNNYNTAEVAINSENEDAIKGAIAWEILAGWTGKNLVINVEAGIRNSKIKYAILEMMRDGKISTSRYNGLSIDLNLPRGGINTLLDTSRVNTRPNKRVVIFANVPPLAYIGLYAPEGGRLLDILLNMTPVGGTYMK